MLTPFPKYNSAVNQSLRPAIASHLATLILLLFLCTQIHSVIHHHDDLVDHPNCSICAVAHHQSADYSLLMPFISPVPIISQVKLFFTVVLITSSAPQTYPSRAPPL
jgi:hypothetical protein